MSVLTITENKNDPGHPGSLPEKYEEVFLTDQNHFTISLIEKLIRIVAFGFVFIE